MDVLSDFSDLLDALTPTTVGSVLYSSHPERREEIWRIDAEPGRASALPLFLLRADVWILGVGSWQPVEHEHEHERGEGDQEARLLIAATLAFGGALYRWGRFDLRVILGPHQQVADGLNLRSRKKLLPTGRQWDAWGEAIPFTRFGFPDETAVAAARPSSLVLHGLR